MTNYYNQLPYNFKTWHQLYFHIEEKGLSSEKNVVFEIAKVEDFGKSKQINKPFEVDKYHFDIDFIKSKCFDEIIPNRFNYSDLQHLKDIIMRDKYCRQTDLAKKISNIWYLLGGSMLS